MAPGAARRPRIDSLFGYSQGRTPPSHTAQDRSLLFPSLYRCRYMGYIG